MDDPERRLYSKFRDIERVDGRSGPGEKHYGCRYFVLDIDHDEFAKAALDQYASACREKYPKLADDIEDWTVRGKEWPLK